MDQAKNLPLPIVIWLVALSFWSGVVYMQVMANSDTIEQERILRVRIWEKLDLINQRLSIIQGKLEQVKK